MNETSDTLTTFEAILKKYAVVETVQSVPLCGWEDVLNKFDGTVAAAAFADDQEKNIFIDLFFSQCLKLAPASEPQQLLLVIEKWLFSRNLEGRCGWLRHEEKIALIHFCVKLREKLHELLLTQPPDALGGLTETQHRLLVMLWRQVFFEPFSALSLFWSPPREEQERHIRAFRAAGYGGLMAASMYQPFDADDYGIDAEALVTAPIPFCYKAIIGFWMITTPYFHGTEKHRLKLMRYVPALCQAVVRHPEIISTFFFFTFVQEAMTGFWRASYFGGNNVTALSAFGDFISLVMQRSFPLPAPAINQAPDGRKIRLGYISRNFYKQAVSCYMVNRVIHHDRDRFDVHVFALGDYHDGISDLFKNNSLSFQRFTNLADLKAIAEAILAKELDILIYADIGMDPVTYMLSGLQLAPVQCALVGHGTTTGMPTIQYYLSGDFEAPGADAQYREKLIRLPQLGAAQYLPMKPERQLSRRELGIPEDAVVFISCANGLKHGLARNPLLVRILREAPDAYILLKPYAHYASIDYKFAEEIVALAKEAGVGDRLKILPPIADAKHVLGLLAIADVQLDTFPYGGWTTNMEALYMGLPVVTQEGELSRSRWGAGMLRALGIDVGIAADEDEYVAWAVRFAADRGLVERLKRTIRRRVRKTLFNGRAAQSAYEQALAAIHRDACLNLSPGSPAVVRPIAQTVIVTSLAPGNYANQRRAMRSWQDAGFKVVSLNALDEIARLQEYFDIDFIAAPRDARQRYGKPYIYFDDLLAYFRHREDITICGIVNSDIHLTAPDFRAAIDKEAKGAFIYGSRMDVDAADPSLGEMYQEGFDYFFFDRKVLSLYPPQNFCLGLPWWDYWAVLVPLMHKVPATRITAPVAAHLRHKAMWDKNIWLELGAALAANFKPPYELAGDNMLKFANDTLQILKKLSAQFGVGATDTEPCLRVRDY